MAGMMKVRHISKMMLSPIIILLVIVMGAGLFFGMPKFTGDKGAVGYRGPSAKVNGVKIKDVEFNKALAQVSQTYGQVYNVEQMKEEALSSVIKAEVINQSVKKSKVRASKEAINRFMAQVEKRYSSPEEMDSLFKSVGISSKNELREIIKNQIERQMFFAKLAERWGVKVTDQEIKSLYEELEMAHILVATNDKVKSPAYSDADALKRANEAYDKIKGGTDFATVAKEYTDDASGKDNGGLLPRQNLASLQAGFDQDFMKAAVKLKSGQVSTPVKTQFGYHIIKMVDRKEAKGKDFNAIKEDYRTDILAQKLQQQKGDKLNKWLKDEMDKANIVVLDPALRAYRLKLEKKWAESAAAYAKALKKKQNQLEVDLYVSASQVLRESKKYIEAIDVLNTYPEEGRLDIRIQTELARINDAMGQKDEAKQILARLSKRIGEEPLMQGKVLSVMKELKYDDEAKALAEKIDKIQKKKAEQAKAEDELLQQQATPDQQAQDNATAQ